MSGKLIDDVIRENLKYNIKKYRELMSDIKLLEEIEEWYRTAITTAIRILQSDQPIKLQDPEDPDNKMEIIGRQLTGFKQGLSFAVQLFDDMPQRLPSEQIELTTEDENLMPCPFCGSEARFFEGKDQRAGHGESYDKTGVECTGCGISVSIGDYADYQVDERKEEAMLKWNRRYNNELMLHYPFKKQCPRCMHGDFEKEEKEGSHMWAYDYHCNNCGLKFELIYADHQSGDHNDTVIIDLNS